jgi:ribosomal protein S3AE
MNNDDISKPSQSIDGLLTSNVTNKPLDEEIFSTIDTTDEQKKAIRSVLQHIKNRKNIPLDIVLQEIQQQYSLEDVPEMNIEESIWYQLTKNERIGFQKQGFRVDIVNGKRVKIPHLSFSSDLDYLDNMINKIIEKIKNIK